MGIKEIPQLSLYLTRTGSKDSIMEGKTYNATANRACSLLYSYIKEHSSGKWLLPVNVCPDVPLTFCLAGVSFSFVDIDAKTLCININEVLKRIEKEPNVYAGVLYVRTYGFLKNTSEEFRSIKCINNNIHIIDDRCLCVPERTPELWGADMILYSTGYCKQIDFGGGGLAFYRKREKFRIDNTLYYDGTDEESIYKEAFKQGKPLKDIPKGWLKMGDYIDSVGYLDKIEDVTSERCMQRALVNSIYEENLPKAIQMATDFQMWRFNIKVPSVLKEPILNSLFENGLFASSHYHSVNRLFNNQTYSVSDSLYECVINLFNDHHYNQEKAYRTCKVVKKILNTYNFPIVEK